MEAAKLDQAERLRRAAEARHAATLARANNAIAELVCAGQSVTFGGLARVARVSRSWLYRQPELRERIEQLRQSPANTNNRRPSQTASTESLRQHLRLYRDEIAKLRAENRALQERLALQLGANRVAATTRREADQS